MASDNKKTITLGLDYSNFDGGVTEVNRKMQVLDSQFKLATEQLSSYGTETDKLALKQDALTQKINLQTQKVKLAKDAYDTAVSSGKASEKQLDNLLKNYNDSQTALEKLNNELTFNKEKLDQLVLSEADRKISTLENEFNLATEKAKKFGNETEQLNIKQSLLIGKLETQAQKVEATKNAYDDAIKSGDKSKNQLNDLYNAYLENEIALEKLNNELADNTDRINNSDKSTKSFGDSIRGMASSLGLEVSPAIESIANKFDGMDKNVGNAIFGIGALITTFSSFTFSAANMADDLLTLSTVTGVTTDELQKMQYASKFLDVDVEVMTNSITKLTRNMDSARNGSKELDKAFETLHVRYKDGNNQLLDVNDVFYKTIDALGKVKNETERDALSMEVFGKSAKELNPLIEAGSQRLKELGIEAQNMGEIMDTESLDKLGKMKDAMDKLELTSGSLKNNLGLQLVPMLTVLFDVIGKIPVPVLETLVVLGSVITTIVLLVKAIQTVTGTANDIKGFFTGLNPSALKTTAIIIGVVAALIALGTVIAVIAGKSNELQSSISSISNSVGQVTQAVNGAQQNTANAVANSNLVQRKSPQYGNTYYAPDVPSFSAGRNFASGTASFIGGNTWLADGGKPEAFTLPKGTKIYNGNETESLLGGDTYNVSFNVNMRDIDDIQKLLSVMNGLKQTGRQGMVKHG